jgi:hypothetical protein
MPTSTPMLRFRSVSFPRPARSKTLPLARSLPLSPLPLSTLSSNHQARPLLSPTDSITRPSPPRSPTPTFVQTTVLLAPLLALSLLSPQPSALLAQPPNCGQRPQHQHDRTSPLVAGGWRLVAGPRLPFALSSAMMSSHADRDFLPWFFGTSRGGGICRHTMCSSALQYDRCAVRGGPQECFHRTSSRRPRLHCCPGTFERRRCSQYATCVGVFPGRCTAIWHR